MYKYESCTKNTGIQSTLPRSDMVATLVGKLVENLRS